MKANIRKYVSLTVMLLLLALTISLLPMEGTLETSYGYKDGFKDSMNSVQTVSLSPEGIRK